MSTLMSSARLPRAPFIYINDPTKDALVASELTCMIPKTIHMRLAKPEVSCPRSFRKSENPYPCDTVLVVSHKLSSGSENSSKVTSDNLQELAIRFGCNFATINLYIGDHVTETKSTTNQLDLPVKGSPDDIDQAQALDLATKIYKWLFTVLTVKETLYLISEKEMREIDGFTMFKDYKYCPIRDCSRVPKDAKIQFVAIVVSKPAVVSANRLAWQVADKTGVANFFFQYRGPSSQHTWDWVLSLEPGQRRSLPRMPCVLIKEHLSTSIIKGPLRLSGSVIEVTGRTIHVIGAGVSSIGKRMRMGRRKRWIMRDDVADYMKQHNNFEIVPSKEKKEVIKVFTEQGAKAWKDNDSSRSTLWDEKVNGNAKKDLD